MRAIRLASFGDPSVLELKDVAAPTTVEKTALARVIAASINPSNVKNLAGVWPAGPFLPHGAFGRQGVSPLRCGSARNATAGLAERLAELAIQLAATSRAIGDESRRYGDAAHTFAHQRYGVLDMTLFRNGGIYTPRSGKRSLSPRVINRSDATEILDLPSRDCVGSRLHRGSSVAEQPRLCRRWHRCEHSARLRGVVIALAMVATIGTAGDVQRWFLHARIANSFL